VPKPDRTSASRFSLVETGQTTEPLPASDWAGTSAVLKMAVNQVNGRDELFHGVSLRSEIFGEEPAAVAGRTGFSDRSRALQLGHAPMLWEPLTTETGQRIVLFVEIDALRADPNEKRSRTMASTRPPRRLGAALVVLRMTLAVTAMTSLGACKQPLVVGEYQCPGASTEAGSSPSATDPISVPWSTGFENRFCDYPSVDGPGYCYGFPPVSDRFVTSPVHTGDYALEITILTGTDAGAQPQERCVRQGVLPTAAYYGAWYYIPATATNAGLWNLFHIQGGNADRTSIHGLWDVSLVNGASGELRAHLYGFLDGSAGDGPPIPIAQWFQLELYLKRAKDKTGEVALYQDGAQVVDFANLITDDSDWGQWYVGNLASALDPPESTVYVDDVTIRATP